MVRNDRIGDLVLTLPAIEAVRRHWPAAHLTALVSPYAGTLLANHWAIDELVFDDPRHGAWQLGRRLRPMRFDTALVINTNTRNCLGVWRAGIPTRVTWAYKAAGFLLGNRRVALHRSHPPVHESDFALAFVRRLGVPTDRATSLPRLDIHPSVRQRLARRIHDDLGARGPLFGVHPGSKNSAYNWPLANYIELVRRLAGHGRVMVTGSPSEQPLLAEVRGQLGTVVRREVAFYADFSLPEMAAAILKQTALSVSSTGPMHLAGVLKTPVVALFSPHPAHAPAKWAPLGDAHTVLTPPLKAGEDAAIGAEKAVEVMARLDVEQVVEANLRYVDQGWRSEAQEPSERAA